LLHRWLIDDSYEAFLDQDLCDGIAVGEEWQRGCMSGCAGPTRVVCLLTSAFVSSTWCSERWGSRSRGGAAVADPG
jgi:hypothetical protein